MSVIASCLAAFASAGFAQQAPPSPQAGPATSQAQQHPPQQGAAANMQPAKAAPAKRPIPQAKTQPEYLAYNAAVSQPNPAEEQTAITDFEAKFPKSELTPLLYRDLLQKYQSQNNTEKMVEAGRKLIALDPDNPLALVLTAMGIAESIPDSDPQKEQKLAEVEKDAQRAIQTTPSELLVPPNITPQEEQMLKSTLIAMAHGTLGYAGLVRADYPQAERELLQSVNMNPQPDPVAYLRLAVAQDHQNKYADAMANATKAVDLARQQGNPTLATLAQNEKERLSKLMGGGATSP